MVKLLEDELLSAVEEGASKSVCVQPALWERLLRVFR